MPDPTTESTVPGPDTTATIVLATHNAKKLAELRRVVGSQVQVLGLSDVADYPEPAETEWTFEGNALIKARACAEITGLPALADDSGIEVDALNQMPGVRSARWSGSTATDRAAVDTENLELLLRQVSDVPAEGRTARFVCAMALVLPDGREEVLRRAWDGHLATAPMGQNGFGYDPIFIPAGESRSSAELSPEEKDAVSHRGQAVRAIWPVVLELVVTGRGPDEGSVA